MKNKKIIGFLVLTIMLSMVAVPVLAQQPTPGTAITPGGANTVTGIHAKFVKIIAWFQAFVLLIGVLMIIWAGLTWMMAGGDATKLGEARQRLTYGLIGIGIAILAYGAQAFVQSLIK